MDIFSLFALLLVSVYVYDNVYGLVHRYVHRKESLSNKKIREICVLFNEYESMQQSRISGVWFLIKTKAKKYFEAMNKPIRMLLLNPYTFIALSLSITVIYVFYYYLRLKTMFLSYMSSIPIYGIVWLGIFTIIFYNVSLILLYSIYSRYISKELPKRVFLKDIPKTAIIYTVRSEGSGLFERMHYTFANNFMANIDLWMLSGDTTEKYLQYEKSVLERLRTKFGNERIGYFHVTDPTVKKAQMVEQWLTQHGQQYKYFLLCDADSLLPHKSVFKLLRFAEHPQNDSICIFQSALLCVNAQSYYGKYLSGGTQRMMFTEVPTNYRIFGQILYFGHNALIRVVDFLNISTPKHILSHDVWDSAYLDSMGKRIAFCSNVYTFEETPTSFLEDIKRIGRWTRGNLQTIPLLFRSNLSISIRFLIFYGIYTYLAQPLFLIWIAMGFMFTQEQTWQGLSGISISSFARFFMVIAVLFFHQVIAGYNFRFKEMLTNILLSTIISINMIFYNTINMLLMPFKKGAWIPMKKNPDAEVTIWEAILYLWPGTLMGMFLLMLSQFHPYWFLLSFPIVLSLVFSIPAVYFTGRVLRTI